MPESNNNPSDESNQTPAQTPANSPSSTDPKNPSDAKNQQSPGHFSSLLDAFRSEVEKAKAEIIAKHDAHKTWLQSVYEEAKTLPVDFDTLKGDLLGEVENLVEVPLLLNLAVIAVKKAQSLDPEAQANFQHLFADLPTV